MIGREQRRYRGSTRSERALISLVGMPVVGLRIRTRRMLALLNRAEAPTLLLDAGCARGVMTFALARKFPGAMIVGIDRSLADVRSAAAIATREGAVRARFLAADLTALPFSGRFDAVVCVDILEHVEDDASALASLRGALCPGGKLYLHVPALYRRYPIFRKRENFHVPGHVRPGYRLEGIARKVEAAGLTILESGSTYGFLETLANNLGYLISRAEMRRRLIYALAFPLLNSLSWLGRNARPKRLGAGHFVVAERRRS